MAAAEGALKAADAVGSIPTPLDAVSEAVGIAHVVNIGDLPDDLLAKKPAVWKRILGAFVYRERVAFVDYSQAEPRVRLTHAHEIGHKILPWHETAYRLDGEDQLVGRTRERLEQEAYLAGGHLLFQGNRFVEHALGYQVSIATPIALADEYAASMHATIRYYVMVHPDPVALIIAGRYSSTGSVPIWTTVESRKFASQFGHLADHLPRRLVIDGGEGRPLGDIAHAALTGSEVATKEVVIHDLGGKRRPFIAEAFFNQHNLLVMCSKRKATRLGKRVRIEATSIRS